MKCKSDLRRAMIARRDALPPTELSQRSARAAERLLALPEFAGAGVVMLFISFGSEIVTLDLVRRALALGKRVAAPRTRLEGRELIPGEIADPERDLTPGLWGIPEPGPECPTVAPEELEAVIVPAAAWSEDGHRLGYGGGYYDRFLRRAPEAHWIGLGLEVQVVPEVPHQEHDLPVDVLVTDERVRRFSGVRRRG